MDAPKATVREITALCEMVKGRDLTFGILSDLPQHQTWENSSPKKFKTANRVPSLSALYPCQNPCRRIHAERTQKR